MPLKKEIAQNMTPLPITIDAGTSLQTVSHLMQRYDIRHIPVVEDGKMIGIAMERDVETLLRVHEIDIQTVPIRKVMVPANLIVSPQILTSEVIDSMVRTKQDYAVISEKGKVVGIFTLFDVLKLLLTK